MLNLHQATFNQIVYISFDEKTIFIVFYLYFYQSKKYDNVYHHNRVNRVSSKHSLSNFHYFLRKFK